MRCPICNAKMPLNLTCPYCKITGDQVVYASNKQAKINLKNGKKSDVYISSYRPFDVSKSTLILITFLLGAFGGDSFYVGRKYKGMFFVVSWLGAIIFAALTYLIKVGGLLGQVINAFTDVFMVFLAITLFWWFLDMIASLIGNYKMPVVLADKEWLKERKKKNNEK